MQLSTRETQKKNIFKPEVNGKEPNWNTTSFDFYKDQLHDRLSAGAEIVYPKRGEKQQGHRNEEDYDDYADDQTPGDYEEVEDEDNLASHHDCCQSSEESTDEDNEDPQ